MTHVTQIVYLHTMYGALYVWINTQQRKQGYDTNTPKKYTWIGWKVATFSLEYVFWHKSSRISLLYPWMGFIAVKYMFSLHFTNIQLDSSVSDSPGRMRACVRVCMCVSTPHISILPYNVNKAQIDEFSDMSGCKIVLRSGPKSISTHKPVFYCVPINSCGHQHKCVCPVMTLIFLNDKQKTKRRNVTYVHAAVMETVTLIYFIWTNRIFSLSLCEYWCYNIRLGGLYILRWEIEFIHMHEENLTSCLVRVCHNYYICHHCDIYDILPTTAQSQIRFAVALSCAYLCT